MTSNWVALIAALLAGATGLHIRLRWRRSPHAFTQWSKPTPKRQGR